MKPDLSKWYTEAEAADAIECSVRNVQRYIAAGKIEVRKRPREGKKPENVLNPRDVDALRPAAFVAVDESESPETLHKTLQRKPALHNGNGSADAFFAFISAITTAIATRQNVAIEAPHALPWLTLDEAAAYSGLSRGYLMGLMETGKVAAVKGGPHGAWRVNRISLEAFAG